jgi:competence CoiA-like predicted nuclease
MKRAKSLLDGRDWDAQEFSQKDNQWQNDHRKELACLSCNAPAVYRAGAKRKPSFAAQHHDECRLGSASWSAFKFLQ